MFLLSIFSVSSTTPLPLYQFLLPWSAFFYWPNETLPVWWSISKDELFHHAILCPSAPVSQSSALYLRRVLSIFLWTSIRSIFKMVHSYIFKGSPYPYLLCFQHFFKRCSLFSEILGFCIWSPFPFCLWCRFSALL